MDKETQANAAQLEMLAVPKGRAKKPRANKRPRNLVGSGSLVGPLLFAPGQLPNYIDLHIVEKLGDLHTFVNAWCPGSPPVDADTKACCCFDYESQGPNHGLVIFAKDTSLTRALVVHELVHAGLIFLHENVMASEAVQAMSEAEKGEYYHEASARIIEDLFGQAESLIWPNTQLSNSGHP